MPWGDKEIARFEKRVALFIRRGWDNNKAETWADRMAERDAEHDTRRCCIECAKLQRNGGCAAAASGALLPSMSRQCRPVQDLFQNCHEFTWAMP